MWVRMSTFQGSSEQSDEEIEQQIMILRENILPTARQMDGYRGILSLGDRSTGKSISLTFWESEEAMRESEEAADRLRQHAADEVKEEIAGVELRGLHQRSARLIASPYEYGPAREVSCGAALTLGPKSNPSHPAHRKNGSRCS